MSDHHQGDQGEQPATDGWSCWVRQGARQPWRQVGTAPSEADAWRLVLQHPGEAKTICRPGNNPNEEGRPK